MLPTFELCDLNYLLYRQQVERSRADFAKSKEAREAHAQLATLYEDAIETLTGGKLTFVRASRVNRNSLNVPAAAQHERGLALN